MQGAEASGPSIPALLPAGCECVCVSALSVLYYLEHLPHFSRQQERDGNMSHYWKHRCVRMCVCTK